MKVKWSKDRNNRRKTYAMRYDIALFTIINHGHTVHLQTTLPGLKIKEPWYPTEAKAQVMAELMFDKWLDQMQFTRIVPVTLDPIESNKDKPTIQIIPEA